MLIDDEFSMSVWPISLCIRMCVCAKVTSHFNRYVQWFVRSFYFQHINIELDLNATHSQRMIRKSIDKNATKNAIALIFLPLENYIFFFLSIVQLFRIIKASISINIPCVQYITFVQNIKRIRFAYQIEFMAV